MSLIRIPRTAVSRRERTYAQLVLRVTTVNHRPNFEGPLFRCGARVEASALRPAPEFPAIPLLIEYVGNDRTGWGHRRSNDIHVLWRFSAARGDWDEIVRIVSQGPEWLYDLAPVVKREIAAPPVAYAEVAGDATARVLALLDAELGALEDEGRGRVMSLLWDQMSARMTEHV